MTNSQARQRVMGHLGSILFNIGIFGVVLCYSAALTGIIWAIIFLFVVAFAFCSIVCSFGMFLLNETYRNFLSGAFKLSTNEKFLTFLVEMIKYFPWIAAITGIVLIASGIFLFFDKNNPSSKGRLIALCVFAVIFIVAIIVIPLVTGGKA